MATTTEFMTTRRPGVFARLLGLAEEGWSRGASMLRAYRNRRSVAGLLAMDERALRDIGITVHDVRSALAVPGWQDPSTQLGWLSGERRAGISAGARERQVRKRFTGRDL